MSVEDYAAYVGREGIWRGRWVMVEVADKDGADVTDQDGGNHSVSWGELDLNAADAEVGRG